MSLITRFLIHCKYQLRWCDLNTDLSKKSF